MKMHYTEIGFAILLSCFAALADAADIAAGKIHAVACQACHGLAGISGNPQWPNLAGQSSAYLEAQLNKFKSGARINPVMQPIASGLSNGDMQNLAVYFASLPAKAAGGDPALAKQGKDKTGMCLGCHGQNLTGQLQNPRLAGQQPDYLYKTLLDFKSGARLGGPMNPVAKSFSEADLKAIAAYLGALTD